MRVRKPRRVYRGSGCAKATSNRGIIATIALAQLKVDETISASTSEYFRACSLADWWDDWKVILRKSLLATSKKSAEV